MMQRQLTQFAVMTTTVFGKHLPKPTRTNEISKTALSSSSFLVIHAQRCIENEKYSTVANDIRILNYGSLSEPLKRQLQAA
jgi:hypothetical protein